LERKNTQRSITHLGVVVASCFNYAGAGLLIILWKIDIFYYLPIAFIISAMIGLLIVEIERSIIYTIVCVVVGNVMAAGILFSPYIVFAESAGSINIASLLIFGSIGKLFLVSVAVYFVGVALGCFLGEKTTHPENLE